MEKFVAGCLHCGYNEGKMVPRPWGEAVHAKAPNEVLHYDFLFISKPRKGDKHNYQYLFVVQDDFSGFRELVLAETADHVVVVNALLDWFNRFGVVKMTVSDQGSHWSWQS